MENVGIEQQIADLERQLQEKKASLEQSAPGAEGLPSEKELLHEIVGEKIQEHAPEYVPKSSTPAPLPATQTQDPPSYLAQDLKDKIQELINLVFSSSIDAAIKSAASTNNPAIMDAFHDVLVDELYEALLERKRIDEVK